MAIGPGKYDAECADVMFKLKADAVLLVVINGVIGNGYSVTTFNIDVLAQLVNMLRSLAAQIEADMATVRAKPN